MSFAIYKFIALKDNPPGPFISSGSFGKEIKKFCDCFTLSGTIFMIVARSFIFLLFVANLRIARSIIWASDAYLLNHLVI